MLVLCTIALLALRSPRELLTEIILVDDASEHDHLGQQLEDYVSTLPVPGMFGSTLYVGSTKFG